MSEPQQEQLTLEQLTDKVAEILTSWPLYRTFSYKGGHATQQRPQGGASNFAMLPKTLSMQCSKCKQLTRWEASDLIVYFGRNEFRDKRYRCRNCGEEGVAYFFWWEGNSEGGVLSKVGQYPALSHQPPRELAKALDKRDAEYYTKGLDCRNFNYGLGAVTYLRRIVERRINDLLDLLAEAAEEAGIAESVAARIQEAKTSPRSEDRAEIVSTLLPERLKPGGQNPFSHIYDVTSDAIHRKSEEECIEAFDKARAAFEYLFVQLRHEKATRAQYLASLKALEEKSKLIRARPATTRADESKS